MHLKNSITHWKDRNEAAKDLRAINIKQIETSKV